MEDSTLKLIRASCTPQSFRDMINTNMKDGKVISVGQAELDDDMEDMMKSACWVDITKGMEMLEQVQYEHKARGQAHLLNPNNPEVLNFSDKQSMKSLNTQITGGTAYTAAFLASLGKTAYMPGNEDIDSQEADLFHMDNDSSVKDPFNTVVDGGIITNLQYVSGLALAGEDTSEKVVDDSQEKEVNKEADIDSSNDNLVVMSLGKVTRKATMSSGIPQEASQGQRNLVQGLIWEWVDKQGPEDLPPNLVPLAECVGIKVTPNDSTSPTCMGCRG
jgi:hypothetical protein